eukprot:TRINITY_DN5653_c0_g1_i14.p1 TRINITY_DN5653_c0_g1~~TRINITY_DN5653_c0_g1_i14.p1  ORF type:complete len:107 (+),score=3.73 TRINITY_DN5653_c0_g1_i14:229-549(+)
MTRLDMPKECEVLSVILLERLLRRCPHVVFSTTNFFPLITLAYIIACKCHQDEAVLLYDFHKLLPIFSVGTLHMMELMFLQSVEYRVFVSRSLYTYYLHILDGEKY